MKRTIGYPYTYGDCGGAINLKRSSIKVILYTFIVSSTIISVPSLCHAVNVTEIADKISECNAVIALAKGKIPISQKDLALCAVAGFCLAKSKEAYCAGNNTVAYGFMCATVVASCAEISRRLAGN